MGFWRDVRLDFITNCDGALKIRNKVRALLFHRGFHALLLYRITQALRKLPIIGPFLARILYYFSCCLYSCELGYYSKLDGGINLPHPCGIIIGMNTHIKRNATILQHVTIGTKNSDSVVYPIIEESAYLGAGAKIIGAVTIGRNAIVGANSVVTKSVPAYQTAIGIPAKCIKKNLSAPANASTSAPYHPPERHARA